MSTARIVVLAIALDAGGVAACLASDGQDAMIGRTVTLELHPEQIIALSSARQDGTLSLALRSITDAAAVEVVENARTSRQDVQIVRHGIASQTTTAQK
jgi:pilus assembly protein CpaB